MPLPSGGLPEALTPCPSPGGGEGRIKVSLVLKFHDVVLLWACEKLPWIDPPLRVAGIGRVLAAARVLGEGRLAARVVPLPLVACQV